MRQEAPEDLEIAVPDPGSTGTQESPFEPYPDPRFFFRGRAPLSAMAALEPALHEGRGCLVVTGEPGAGKTSLVAHLLGQIERNDLIVGRIDGARLKTDDLLQEVGVVFGLPLSDADIRQRIARFLIDQAQLGKRLLLVIDDAQDLREDCFRALCWLAVLQWQGRTLLQVLLIGQPGLEPLLSHAELEPLRRNVALWHDQQALAPEEIGPYIKHRLSVAGRPDDPLFTETAVARIHRLTGGLPARINLLCRDLLRQAEQDGKSQIEDDDVDAVGLALTDRLGVLPEPQVPAEAPAVESCEPDEAMGERRQRIDLFPEEVYQRPKRWRTVALIAVVFVVGAFALLLAVQLSNVQPRLAELERLLEEERAEKESLSEKVADLTRERRALIAGQQQREIERAELATERDKLSARVYSLERSLGQQTPEPQGDAQALATLRAEIAGLRAQNDELAQALSAAKADQQASEKRAADAQNALRETRESITEARETLDSQKREVDRLNQQLFQLSESPPKTPAAPRPRPEPEQPGAETSTAAKVPAEAPPPEAAEAEAPKAEVPKAEPGDSVATEAATGPGGQTHVALSRAAGGPAEFLERLGGEVVSLYRSGSYGADERRRRLQSLLSEHIDLGGFTREILGQRWQSADAGQRAEYLALVENYLFNPFVRFLENDGVRQLKVVKAGPVKDSESIVTTRLETQSGDAREVMWKIRQNGGSFQAVDLLAQGVSILGTFQSELKSYASSQGVDALLKTLRSLQQQSGGNATGN